MKLALILTLFLFSVSLWADCRVSTGTEVVIIPESKSVSLFDKGRSLENHKVQDQDGLSTCYANTTSAVLKSILPNHPDVSYTHAALSSATQGWSAKGGWATDEGKAKYISKIVSKEKDDKGVEKEKVKYEDFTSGGYVCETIAALRKNGGACPQTKSLIEKKELQNPDVQERIFLGLGKYFDKMNDIKKNPQLMESFKKDLALSIEKLNVENSNFVRKCEESKKVLPVDVALETLGYAAADTLLQDKSACASKRIAVFKSVLAPGSKVKSDYIQVEYSPAFINKLRAAFAADINLSKDIETFFNAKKEDKVFNSALSAKVEKLVDSFLNHELKTEDQACPTVINGKSFLTSSSSKIGQMFLDDMKYDHNRDCSQEMKMLKSLEFDSVIGKNQCSDPTNVKIIAEAIEPLLDIGYKLDDALLEALSNPVSLHGDQLTKVLHPECADKAKLVPVDNVACASFTTCDTSMYKNLSNDIYSGPKGGCMTMDKAKSMISTKAFNAITADRALGVSVCTAFLEDPTQKTNFCKTAGKGVEGHSMHAMTISGYRCVAGKIEYELLNSWGSGYCPVPDGKLKSDAFDCVQDKYGNPSGRFWVKEDVLVDSTTDVNSVTVKSAK